MSLAVSYKDEEGFLGFTCFLLLSLIRVDVADTIAIIGILRYNIQLFSLNYNIQLFYYEFSYCKQLAGKRWQRQIFKLIKLHVWLSALGTKSFLVVPWVQQSP